MMATQELSAERRTVLGKKVGRLRRAGRLPGVVYGPVVEGTVPVTVDTREFQKFYQSAGHSTLFVLKWEDGQQSVFIREVQRDPVRRNPLHVDFFAPNLRRPVRAMVPIVMHNPATLSDGVLTEERTEIEVEALPTHIPHQIDIDVSGLQHPGDAIRVADVTFPPGVTPVLDGEELIIIVSSTYRAPEPEEEVEATAEQPEATAEVAEVAEEAAESAGEE